MANNFRSFFIEALAVPPNRFRPENKMNGIFISLKNTLLTITIDMTFLHEHTVMLTKVLETNGDIKKILIDQKNEDKDGEKTKKKEPVRPEDNERVFLFLTFKSSNLPFNRLS